MQSVQDKQNVWHLLMVVKLVQLFRSLVSEGTHAVVHQLKKYKQMKSNFCAFCWRFQYRSVGCKLDS